MRVDVDDSRGHKFTGTIDHHNIRWDRGAGSPNTADLAAGHEHDAIVDLAEALG
jgi:hypothetical protein